MATIYSEATLAQKYRTTIDGQVAGGLVYYIRGSFKGKFGKALAGIFAVLIIWPWALWVIWYNPIPSV